MAQTPQGINYTPEEIRAILRERPLDNPRVQLVCRRHGYLAKDVPPKPGCVDCWKVWYWYMFANTPPHLRLERLEQLEKLLRAANADAAAGKFDVELFAHPEFHVEKDVQDDSVLTRKRVK